MLHEDDGEEGHQVEEHTGAVVTAAVQQEVCYKNPVRNRITGSSGEDGQVVEQETGQGAGQGAARIEEALVEVVVAVLVPVADLGELRAARVVRGRAGTVCAGLVLRRAHLRRH